MAEIRVLPQAVADKIAAGEVVERPAAAVKELVENAIDAGADKIRVEIKNGGIKYISIEDNGKGIPEDELEFAFIRHATSKLREIDDLYEIQTMGFRGEALASICAVSEVQVLTRTKTAEEGTAMTVKGGKTSEKTSVACNFGTTMVIENLFANVPARMKFLKKDSTEAGYVTDVMGRIALANPHISFKYICDGKEVFSTSGDGQLKNVILNVYGIDHAKGAVAADYREHGIHVYGMVGKSELARGNRTRQTLLVNGRYIKNHVVSKVVEEAYRNVLMTGKFPFFVLNIDLAPQMVDVNVHPAKTEIKFANEKEVYNVVFCAVKNALYRPADSSAEERKDSADKSFSVVDTKADSTMSAKSEPVISARDTAGSQPDRRLIKEFMKNTVSDGNKSVFSFGEPKRGNEEKITTESLNIFKESEKITGKEALEAVIKSAEGSALENVETRDAAAAEESADIKPNAEEPHVSGDAPKTEIPPKTEQLKLFEDSDEGGMPQSLPVKIVGQVFDTYLIVQQGDKMYMIDQHAAHERKRFEMLKADYTAKKKSGQMLLSPIVLEVDGIEMQAVKENSQLLSDLGFEMEEFGRGAVIIRETPLIADEEDIKALAMEVISALSDGRPMGLLSFEERLLDMISCKYAIKANKSLTAIEQKALLEDVEELEAQGISTCPHGRPIKIEFTKREIEKMFKRIV